MKFEYYNDQINENRPKYMNSTTKSALNYMKESKVVYNSRI